MKSAIAIAATITFCLTAILAAKRILHYCSSCTYCIEIFTSAFAVKLYEEIVSFDAEQKPGTSLKTSFKTCQFNESNLLTCHLQSERNYSGNDKCTLYG